MSSLLPRPTDAELAILQRLWKSGPGTVKEVQDQLEPGTRYTTVLKFLQIMTGKGLVRRDESQRAHVYHATRSENETQQQLVTTLLKKAFGGSSSKLVMQALASKKASSKELAEIKRLVDELTRKQA